MNDIVVDVRPMTPRERHPAIFGVWKDLREGGALLLVNDHDPVPLYYQLACEHTGTFRWEYQEQGPVTWKVRLTKGNFSDPGYVPPRKMAGPANCSVDASQPRLVDTRPMFAAGETPCQVIEDAADQTPAGQSFVLIAPFEPAPLYKKLGQQGFAHTVTRLEDGAYRIEFRRNA